VPPIEPRLAARAAAITGALAWPTLWVFNAFPQPIPGAHALHARVAVAGMYALTPMLLLLHGPWQGLSWPVNDLLGCALNAGLWAVLAGGAAWGRLHLRRLMWGILTLVGAWWAFVAGVALVMILQGV
jgi:hypothetical protein